MVGERFETKGGDAREQWATGSQRDSRAGRGRFDLLPPRAIARLAQLYERGAAKYGDRNWEKGQPLSRYLDSALRHMFQLLAGDEDEDHAAAVAWNALGFMETQRRVRGGELPKELDDIPRDGSAGGPPAREWIAVGGST